MEFSDLNNNNQSQPSGSGSCNGMLYTIRRGDTLYKLSKRYNVSLSTIMNANPNINVYNLQVGQQICIPGRMSTDQGTSGGSNQMMPNRRPVTGGRYPNKVKGDQFQNFECPACPAQQPCPEQQPCPSCPEQQPCPTCPVQQPCPTCPVCRDCPVCPECETCPTCPVCPECETCPTCPEQQPCEACPTCPEQQPCPTCPECEACPEQQPCPMCPEQQPCPACPEQQPCPTCPTCQDKHTVVFVGPKYEKSYKMEQPCCKKPMMECKKSMMDCKKSKSMPCDYMDYGDMDARMGSRRGYGYSMDYDDVGYGYKNRRMMDYDDAGCGCKMGKMMDYDDAGCGCKMGKMMDYDDAGCGCKMRKMMDYDDDNYGMKYDKMPREGMYNTPNSCHKMMPYTDCKGENKCFDTDYMGYEKKMYRSCFKKAMDRPWD